MGVTGENWIGLVDCFWQLEPVDIQKISILSHTVEFFEFCSVRKRKVRLGHW